jgi:RNA recognition motif-containing protein
MFQQIRNTIFRNYGLTPINTKIARDRLTGASRGFGFLDFDDLELSRLLMDTTNGGLYIGNDFVTLEYSHSAAKKQQQLQQKNENESNPSGKEQTQQPVVYRDWICEHCNARNFGYRSKCFQCHEKRTANSVEVEIVSKDEQAPKEHNEEHHLKPTVELIVRSLSPLTVEETLVHVFSHLAPVKACRVIRDKVTMQSRQFAFIEFFSVEAATQVLQQIKSMPNFTIDGANVNVAYAKRQHISSDENDQHAIDEATIAQWSSYYNYTGGENQQPQITTMSGYTYDEASGYYYNPQCNFYYDPKTTYFYDNNSSRWLYYDAEQQTYFPVGENGEIQKQEQKPLIGPTLPEKKPEEEQQEKKPVELTEPVEFVKPIVSLGRRKKDKQINKDIAQWNKRSQQLKEEMQKDLLMDEFQKSLFMETAKASEPSTSTTINQQTSATDTNCTSIPAETEVVETIGKGFVPNPEYQKALELIEKKEKNREFEMFQKDIEVLFGEATKKMKQESKKRKISEVTTTEEQQPVENIGAKLLKKLGWNEGEGLGKSKAGITAPIDSQLRLDRVGLGFPSSSNVTSSVTQVAQQRSMLERLPGESYQEVCRKRARARFESLK